MSCSQNHSNNNARGVFCSGSWFSSFSFSSSSGITSFKILVAELRVVLAAVLSNPLIVVAGIIACPTFVDVSSIAPDTCFFFPYIFCRQSSKSQKKEIKKRKHIDQNFSLTFRVFFLFANLPVRISGLFLRRRKKMNRERRAPR